MNAQLWRNSPGAEERRGLHISQIVPTVREATAAVVQSGFILENSLILHRLLYSVRHQWVQKFHPHSLMVSSETTLSEGWLHTDTATQLYSYKCKWVCIPMKAAFFVSNIPDDWFYVSSRIPPLPPSSRKRALPKSVEKRRQEIITLSSVSPSTPIAEADNRVISEGDGARGSWGVCVCVCMCVCVCVCAGWIRKQGTSKARWLRARL